MNDSQYISNIKPLLSNENAKIVLIGPSNYLSKIENGSIFDSFDVVCRPNKGFHMTKEPHKYGSRTDILFHNLNDKYYHIEKIKNQYNVNQIVYTFPILGERHDTYIEPLQITDYYSRRDPDFLRNIYCFGPEEYLNLEKNLSAIPNTGIISLKMILDSNINFCYLTGFSFYNETSIGIYDPKKNGPKFAPMSSIQRSKRKQLQIKRRLANKKTMSFHDQHKMKIYFVTHLLYHPKLYIDQFLANLLKKDSSIKHLLDPTLIKIFDKSMIKQVE